jgi:hypothetical protein
MQTCAIILPSPTKRPAGKNFLGRRINGHQQDQSLGHQVCKNETIRGGSYPSTDSSELVFRASFRGAMSCVSKKTSNNLAERASNSRSVPTSKSFFCLLLQQPSCFKAYCGALQDRILRPFTKNTVGVRKTSIPLHFLGLSGCALRTRLQSVAALLAIVAAVDQQES